MSNYIGLKQILFEHYNIGNCCDGVDETLFNLTYPTNNQVDSVDEIKIYEPNTSEIDGKTIPQVYEIVKDGDLADKCYLWNTIQQSILDKTTLTFNTGVRDNFINIQKDLCPEKTESEADMIDEVTGPCSGTAEKISGFNFYKFKDVNDNETCLCYWKQVRELVNGDVKCHDSLKVTIQDDRLGLGKPTPRKVTRYRVSAKCVKTYDKIDPKYLSGGYPITVEQSYLRRPGDEPQVQRISGSNQPQRRQQPPTETPPPPVSKKPNFTDDEKYILGLFKD